MIKVWCLWMAAMLAVASLVAGCAQGDEVPPATEVQVEYISSSRGFRVTYETSIEARALVFNRGKTAFRSRSWVPQGSNQHIEFRDGKEVLLALRPSRKFEIIVPEQFGDLTGDYPLMTRFSNGGIVLYTGHLEATPISCFELCTEGDVRSKARIASPIHLTLVPSKGGRVMAGGEQTNKALSVPSPTPAEGLFAYFGNLTPISRTGYSVVVDPEIPAWILPELDRYFPQILDLNSRRLARSVSVPPVILIPYKSGAGSYASAYSGAVVSNQMVLSLFGGSWTRRTPEAREQFLKLLAHESFHFWNSSLYHSVDVPGGSWLHEGSADAFAYLGLLELGVISANRYAELQSEALNRCLVGLSGSSLPTSNRIWGFRNFYECGAMIQQLMARGAKRAGSDLWRLWSRMFDAAQSNGGYYTHDDFFRLAREETGSSLAINSVQLLTSGELKGTNSMNDSSLESFFIGAFANVGVVLVDSDQKWPAWYHRLVVERALSAAIESDCKGDGYFVALNERAKLVGNATCRNLKGDREIGTIGRYSIWKEGVQVYELIRRQCSSHSIIEMSELNSGERVRLLCPQLPRRPSFLRFPDDNSFE